MGRAGARCRDGSLKMIFPRLTVYNCRVDLLLRWGVKMGVVIWAMIKRTTSLLTNRLHRCYNWAKSSREMVKVPLPLFSTLTPGGGVNKPVRSISSNKFSMGRAGRGTVSANKRRRWCVDTERLSLQTYPERWSLLTSVTFREQKFLLQFSCLTHKPKANVQPCQPTY